MKEVEQKAARWYKGCLKEKERERENANWIRILSALLSWGISLSIISSLPWQSAGERQDWPWQVTRPRNTNPPFTHTEQQFKRCKENIWHWALKMTGNTLCNPLNISYYFSGLIFSSLTAVVRLSLLYCSKSPLFNSIYTSIELSWLIQCVYLLTARAIISSCGTVHGWNVSPFQSHSVMLWILFPETTL